MPIPLDFFLYTGWNKIVVLENSESLETLKNLYKEMLPFVPEHLFLLYLFPKCFILYCYML